ncbi:MAG: RluA family pseudouridine synthase, partial [Candidatus Methylomirabilota bacterium]
GTLVNALLYHCKDLAGINGVLRPGIVHRLDKDTSGVMVVAKDDEAYHHLAKQFKNRTVKKVYRAIVYGRVSRDEGLIDSDIGRHPSERKRMSTRTKRGRPAITRWRKVEELDGVTLVQLEPQTGRTHQIRVHLSAIGHPVVGDKVYGGRREQKFNVQRSTFKAKAERHLLHAWKLGLFHPRTHEWMEFEAPPPEDFR